MRLYLVRGDLAFSLLQPIPDAGWQWRGGVPAALPWEAPYLIPLGGEDAEFIEADCFSLNTGTDGFIVSEFARAKLDALLSPAGEFLPIRVCGRPYWWFNCLVAVEALDRDQTEADWGLVEGDWGSFRWITSTRRLAFDPARLAAVPAMFRIPEYPQGVLFATRGLEEAVEQNELTGFRFDLIWSSRDGGVSDPPGVGLGGMFDEIARDDSESRRAAARAVLERRGRLDRRS